MSAVELNEPFFARIAGWEAMKQARGLLAADKVLSSNWTAPVLKGVVQDGSTSYRAGLVIKDHINIENLCGCRSSRQWGTICAHSVAVGLHHLKSSGAGIPPAQEAPGTAGGTPAPLSNRGAKRVRRVPEGGEAAEVSIILPPNFEPAAARGKVMLCFEAAWRGGRVPLNALPQSQNFSFSSQDAALLDQLELLAGGDTPAMIGLDTKSFSALLPFLVEHARVTLGKSTIVRVESKPWTPPLKATLTETGEIELALKEKVLAPVLIEEAWVFQNRCFQPLALSKTLPRVLQGPLRLSRIEVPAFLIHDWPTLQASGMVEAN